jgi:hypothetical protein
MATGGARVTINTGLGHSCPNWNSNRVIDLFLRVTVGVILKTKSDFVF